MTLCETQLLASISNLLYVVSVVVICNIQVLYYLPVNTMHIVICTYVHTISCLETTYVTGSGKINARIEIPFID